MKEKHSKLEEELKELKSRKTSSEKSLREECGGDISKWLQEIADGTTMVQWLQGASKTVKSVQKALNQTTAKLQTLQGEIDARKLKLSKVLDGAAFYVSKCISFPRKFANHSSNVHVL